MTWEFLRGGVFFVEGVPAIGDGDQRRKLCEKLDASPGHCYMYEYVTARASGVVVCCLT